MSQARRAVTLARGLGAVSVGLLGGLLAVPCALLALWAVHEDRPAAVAGWLVAVVASLVVGLLVATWLRRQAFVAALTAYVVGVVVAVVVMGLF